MEPYANLGGNSGVTAYEVDDNSIAVQFKDGSVYEYTRQSAGRTNIDRMVSLARHGQGLNTFIAQHVRKLYVRKINRPH